VQKYKNEKIQQQQKLDRILQKEYYNQINVVHINAASVTIRIGAGFMAAANNVQNEPFMDIN